MFRLGEFDTDTLKVTAVRLGVGCREACSQCGAYGKAPNAHAGDYIMGEVDPVRMADCILQEVDKVLDTEDGEPEESKYGPIEESPGWRFVIQADGGWHFEDQEGTVLNEKTLKPLIDTRLRLIHYFDSIVTTDVNQEPLNGDAFLHFYKLVRLLSGGTSRVPLITHGLRTKKDGKVVDNKAEERLKKIVGSMDSSDLITLSLDCARSWGNISKEVNVRSYAETLDILKPALDKGVRVTVSLQGNEDSGSRLYRVRVEKLWGRLKHMLVTKYGWTQMDIGKIHTDTGRNWTWRGRAEGMPGIHPENECPVIPDGHFVSRYMSAMHARMAVVDAVSGKTYAHTFNTRRTYNDVSTLSRWLARSDTTLPMNGWEEIVVNAEPLPDLAGQFTREARLATFRALFRLRRASGGPAPTAGLLEAGGPQPPADNSTTTIDPDDVSVDDGTSTDEEDGGPDDGGT